MTIPAPPSVILASSSTTRLALLERAGVTLTVTAPDLDERAVKTALFQDGVVVETCAERLAREKAGAISVAHPEALVIGSDQILECDNQWFDKPRDKNEARQQLLLLSGRTHRLVSAAVVMRAGKIVWSGWDAAHLRMRVLSDEFLAYYLDHAGKKILTSVGAYQLEDLGAQLFERVDGDYFTILGLPLLRLLAVLRDEGVLPR